jgi:hypothetical protein
MMLQHPDFFGFGSSGRSGSMRSSASSTGSGSRLLMAANKSNTFEFVFADVSKKMASMEFAYCCAFAASTSWHTRAHLRKRHTLKNTGGARTNEPAAAPSLTCCQLVRSRCYLRIDSILSPTPAQGEPGGTRIHITGHTQAQQRHPTHLQRVERYSARNIVYDDGYCSSSVVHRR